MRTFILETVKEEIKDLSQKIEKEEELWLVELLEDQVIELLIEYAVSKNYHLHPSFAFLNITQLLEAEDDEGLKHPVHDYLHYWLTRMASEETTYQDIRQLMDRWSLAYPDFYTDTDYKTNYKVELTTVFKHIHHE